METIAALEESENRLHTFIRASTSSLILTDSEFKVIEVNDAGLKVSGLSREEVIGKHILDFNPETLSTGRFEIYKEVRNKKRPFYIDEIKLPISLGGNRIILSVFPAGNGIGMIVTDISELEKRSKT
jgi:PAS domain S-box-containing protein